jgi:hypothetical protein
MLSRLTISFTPDETKALRRLSEMDFRPPKDQVRWLVRQEAKRRGLWLPDDAQDQQVEEGCDVQGTPATKPDA